MSQTTRAKQYRHTRDHLNSPKYTPRPTPSEPVRPRPTRPVPHRVALRLAFGGRFRKMTDSTIETNPRFGLRVTVASLKNNRLLILVEGDKEHVKKQVEQIEETHEGTGPHEKEGPAVRRWQAATAHVRGLQRCGLAEKTGQSPRPHRQPPKNRLFGGQPACRDRGHQAGPFHGPAAVRRRIARLRSCDRSSPHSPQMRVRLKRCAC